MKNLISSFFVLALMGCTVADLSVRKGYSMESVRSVAVMDFSSQQGAQAADVFSKELATLMGYAAVDRAQVQKTAVTLGLTEAERLDPNTAKRLGISVGADAVVMGSVTPALESGRLVVPRPITPNRTRQKGKSEDKQDGVSPALNVSVSLVKVVSGEILWIGRATANGTSAQASLRSAARQIIKRLKKELATKS
jgi:hypothetical protein